MPSHRAVSAPRRLPSSRYKPVYDAWRSRPSAFSLIRKALQERPCIRPSDLYAALSRSGDWSEAFSTRDQFDDYMRVLVDHGHLVLVSMPLRYGYALAGSEPARAMADHLCAIAAASADHSRSYTRSYTQP